MPAKPAFASPSSTAAYDGAMAHPPRYDDRDPLLARVRELAFALPEAKEKISHGTPTFFINGVRFEPRRGFEELLDAVQAQLDGAG